MSNATRIKQLQGDTIGSVLFIGTGGRVTEDNSNLFWDDMNNALGIGTNNITSNSKVEIVKGVTVASDASLSRALYVEHTAVGNLPASGPQIGSANVSIINNQTVNNASNGITGSMSIAAWTQSTTANISMLGGDALVGAFGYAQVIGNGTTANPTAAFVFGLKGTVTTVTSDANITEAHGVKLEIAGGNAGTISRFRGVYIPDMSAITGAPAASSRYGLYIEDGGYNYIEGTLGIGTGNPIAKLDIRDPSASFVTVAQIIADTTTAITGVRTGITVQNNSANPSVGNIGLRASANGNIANRNIAIVGVSGGNSGFTIPNGRDVGVIGQINSTPKASSSSAIIADNRASSGTRYAVEIDDGNVASSGIFYGTYYKSTAANITTKYGHHVAIGSTNTTSYGSYIDVYGATNPYALVINRGNTIFNESGGDYDFRVEGDTDQNLLFIDASTDRIGIGNNTPSEKLEITGNIVLSSGAQRTISVASVASGTGNNLEIKSASSSGVNGIGGNIIISAGNATAGGSSQGGVITINGGTGNGFQQGDVILQTANNARVGIGTSSASVKLHVAKSVGTIPSLSGDTIALFQHNLVSTSNAQISILGGSAATSRIYFGSGSGETKGTISYNNVTDVLSIGTNSSVSNGVEIDENGNLNTNGVSASTRYDSVASATTIALAANIEFILAEAAGGRFSADLQYNLPSVGTHNIKDGHTITFRTLGITTGSITLVATSSSFHTLSGTTPASIACTQNTAYKFIYQSTYGRWVQII